MTSLINVKQWISLLGKKQWEQNRNHWNSFNKDSLNYLFEITQKQIINDIEKFILQSPTININKEDLNIGYEDLGGFINSYNLQFLYCFKDAQVPFLNLFDYIPIYLKNTTLFHAIEESIFYFNIIKTYNNKMLLFMSIEKKESIFNNFSIKLPSPKNKKRIKNFKDTNEIEDFIEYKTAFANKLHVVTIPVYYKQIELGTLKSNKDKCWTYSFKLSNIKRDNFIKLFSYYYNEESFIERRESEVLPEYKIYKCNHLENTILITTHENEDYGSYNFLKTTNELLNNYDKLKSYIEDILFS